MEKMKKRKQERENYNKNKQEKRTINQECTNIEGITLLALVITIVLNCSYLAMDQMNKIEKI